MRWISAVVLGWEQCEKACEEGEHYAFKTAQEAAAADKLNGQRSRA